MPENAIITPANPAAVSPAQVQQNGSDWAKDFAEGAWKEARSVQPPSNPTPAPPASATSAPADGPGHAQPDATAPEPPVPVPEPEIEIPTGETVPAYRGKVGHDFKVLKEKHKTEMDGLRAELDRTKAELAKHTSGQPDQSAAKLEALAKEKQQLEDTLRVVALERDPTFRNFYDGRRKTAVDAAASLVGKDKAEALQGILSIANEQYRDEALSKLMEGLPHHKQIMLGSALMELNKIESERNADLGKSKELYAQREAKQAEETKAREAKMEAEFNLLKAQWTDPEKGMPVFQHNGDKAHNEEVDSAMDEAFDLVKNFGNLPASQQIRAGAWVVAGPRLIKAMQNMGKALTEAQANLQRLAGGAPNPADGGSNTQPTDPYKNMDVGKAIAIQIPPELFRGGR